MRKQLPKISELSRAQTLVSLLIAIALFAILASALFTLVASSYSLISFTSARVTAKQLAQEKMESIRNLPYDSVGTTGGIPSGPIEQSSNLVRNGLNYIVYTSIIYVDDSFDGIAPADLLPTDYKRVRIDVSWYGSASSSKNPVTFISDISPKGLESAVGGGTLSILVFDANAQPVGQAEISIVADEVNPAVNLTLQTSDNGRVLLPGALPCIDCYKIVVSKDGYSSQRTYAISEVANPDKPHVSILEGELTEISFAIDLTSNLTINSHTGRELNFENLGSIALDIRGDKTIGTDASDKPVYKYQNQLTTDGGGELALEDLEWDNYYITLPSASGWTFSGTNPLHPILLNPNTNIFSNLALNQRFSNSLFITFTDSPGIQVASVSASLFDGGNLIASASSGITGDPDFGQVLFNDLSATIYNLVATVSGYLDFNGDYNVSGNDNETVILNSP